MFTVRALILAVGAGLNPWLVLLITVGLATFTDRAPLTPPFAWARGIGLLALLALLTGVDLVAGKVPRLTRLVERLSLPAVAAAGAILALATPTPLAPFLAAGAGAALAVVVRLGRRRFASAINVSLLGLGHVLAGMVADLLAAIAAAIAYALTI